MTTARPVPSYCSAVTSSSSPLFPAHQQRLRRTFSSKHYRHNGSSAANPYLVLGVPVNSSYETVKSAFLKQAMQHHPDSSNNNNGGDTTIFVRIRQAFEEIVQDHKKGGGATSRDNTAWQNAASHTSWKNEAEFQEWFRQETSNHLTFDMSDATRQEVIRVYRSMSNGGRDLRGGYWEMARQLAEREAGIGVAGDNSSTTAAGQLEVAGKTSSSSSPSNLRRRRRR